MKGALAKVEGVQAVNCSVADQTVEVKGIAPPSHIVKAVQGIGKDAIVRGTGKPNSAAVSILESFLDADQQRPVKGLARIVSVGAESTLFDISLNGLAKGKYHVAIQSSGDLSEGPMSTGPERLYLGEVNVAEGNEETPTPGLDDIKALDGFHGAAYFRKQTGIADLIGRSMVVNQKRNVLEPSSLVGVIARSAGVWENTKTVCSCSGKTVWQEREDAVQKGVN